MRVFYWQREGIAQNFGDALNVLLVQRMLNVTVEWEAPADCEAVVIGSVIDVLPDWWNGTIAGAGKLHETSQIPAHALVLGVRGLLTAAGRRGDIAIGDPALLVDELVPPQEKMYDLGVVPHWTDHVLAPRFAHLHPHVIHADWPPARAITNIAQCKRIVSSSLHGIIVADSFGIPRRTETFPNMRTYAEGGSDYKFRDHASAVGLPVTYGKMQEPNRDRIERRQAELFDMIAELGGLVASHA